MYAARQMFSWLVSVALLHDTGALFNVIILLLDIMVICTLFAEGRMACFVR